MNHYFTPRTPEPKPRAFAIILRSMVYTILVVAVAVGIWLGQNALLNERVSNELTRDEWSEASTNNVEQVATRSP